MEIIKIEKQPSVTEYIERMIPGTDTQTLRFHLSHIKAVREAAGRKMKIEKPHLKYITSVDAIAGYIQVSVEVKKKGGKNEQIQNN